MAASSVVPPSAFSEASLPSSERSPSSLSASSSSSSTSVSASEASSSLPLEVAVFFVFGFGRGAPHLTSRSGLSMEGGEIEILSISLHIEFTSLNANSTRPLRSTRVSLGSAKQKSSGVKGAAL